VLWGHVEAYGSVPQMMSLLTNSIGFSFTYLIDFGAEKSSINKKRGDERERGRDRA
jgi:hypothetical protein